MWGERDYGRLITTVEVLPVLCWGGLPINLVEPASGTLSVVVLATVLAQSAPVTRHFPRFVPERLAEPVCFSRPGLVD